METFYYIFLIQHDCQVISGTIYSGNQINVSLLKKHRMGKRETFSCVPFKLQWVWSPPQNHHNFNTPCERIQTCFPLAMKEK